MEHRLLNLRIVLAAAIVSFVLIVSGILVMTLESNGQIALKAKNNGQNQTYE